MNPDTLSARALNRATLARQLLIEPSRLPARDAVHHLVGMQAQVPLNPYVGLWSRLDGFRAADLAQLVLERELVRIVVMRGTLHLVTADDCLLLRPLVQPVLDQELARHSEYAPKLHGVDLAPVLEFARALLAEQALSGPRLRAALAERFPDLDAAALAYACRNHLALVQVPPRGVWGRSGGVVSTTAESYLGRPLVAKPSIDEVILRYLGAFGPASAADAAAWSRLTGMREVLERLGPRLRRFRDERGRELFDLPGSPRPDPDTPVPVHFFPEYDNLLLSHADRSRFQSARHREVVAGERAVQGTVLWDGVVVGTWRIDASTLVVDHVPWLTKRATSAVQSRGRRLLAFLERPDHDVRLVPLG